MTVDPTPDAALQDFRAADVIAVEVTDGVINVGDLLSLPNSRGVIGAVTTGHPREIP